MPSSLERSHSDSPLNALTSGNDALEQGMTVGPWFSRSSVGTRRSPVRSIRPGPLRVAVVAQVVVALSSVLAVSTSGHFGPPGSTHVSYVTGMWQAVAVPVPLTPCPAMNTVGEQNGHTCDGAPS